MLRLIVAGAALAALAASGARADSGWMPTGDEALRIDLQLLNDAEVIRYPVSQWPIPRAGLQHALATAREFNAVNDSVKAALERVRARLDPGGFSIEGAVRGGEPALVRDFDTLAREQGELVAGISKTGERLSAVLVVTAAADPADGRRVRLDGSHATLALGNWLVSANTLERWWGPGHESSLIFSNNARPMPTVSVERAAARPFESRWLDWLGPWRFHFAISRMESERDDIDAPLFMAWRVVVMPLNGLELGFSRTAQFCGEQLECNLRVFGNLLAGNDNVGIDATPENEPGNQMAGFDMRWASPIGTGPYALYAQFIGEDESSYLPAKYLGQLGVEVWKPFADGDILLMFAEYANTICSGLSSHGPYYNCAYNQGRFDVEGYRYRDRSIGHTFDGDAESGTVGARVNTAGGTSWSVTARYARLNRDGLDVRNTVSPDAARYGALEAGWRKPMFGGTLAVQLGAESLDTDVRERSVEPYGFVSWRFDLTP